MPDDRFVMEVNRRVVGLALKVAGGFRFFASDPKYLSLDSRTFPRVRALAAKIAEVARRRDPEQAERPSFGTALS
jgi:hypothetical protein